ncbi:hypothetical protein ACGFI9_37360 [Micromonospora sp. NPDC048930]|uniref:hypothetical protein n=1 Tax=Micromonospora sp. NPDC048930 TaxID=3364261 RepID=UPI003719737D
MANKQPDWTGYCDAHGKRLFSSRKRARKQIREHRNGKGMREYPCTLVDGHFHIGHLPREVRRGYKTVAEVHGRKR